MEEKFNEIQQLMAVPEQGLKAYAHGQIKHAATRAIELLGHEWTRQTRIYEESNQTGQIRRKLKAIVLASAQGWHSNKDIVWSRFRGYAVERSKALESHTLANRMEVAT